MSIFQKIFGSAPTPNAGQPPMNPNAQPNAGQAPNPTNNLQTNPQPAGTHQSNGTAPNGVVPADGNQPGIEVSPLDKYKAIWETPTVDPSKQTQEPQGVTPEKMMEAAAKVDFTKVVDRETVAKIAAGGDGAVEALLAVINKTSQTVYGQSSVVAQKLVDRAVEQATEAFTAKLPGLVRQQSLKESLLQDNPAFKDPAVAPIVEALQQQFAQKYPNASAADLKQMAQEYFAGAAQVMSPQKPTKSSTAASKDDVDWDSWVNTPTPLD